MKNLAGKYKALVWWALLGNTKRRPPGSLLELSHEDAERALAQKTARPLTSEELDALAELAEEAKAQEPVAAETTDEKTTGDAPEPPESGVVLSKAQSRAQIARRGRGPTDAA